VINTVATSFIAAKLCNYVSHRRERAGLYKEIAQEIISRINRGNLLDIGTGAGMLLKSVYCLNPTINLYGLDISEAIIKVAKKNLEEYNISADLRQGNIERTNYDNNFFHLATCTASFSYWNHPITCLDEIHRILKKGGLGVLFEPYQEINMEELKETIETSLQGESRLRKFFAIRLNVWGLKYGHRLGLKLYTLQEIEEIVKQTRFAENYLIEKISVAGFPVYSRIILPKQDPG